MVEKEMQGQDLHGSSAICMAVRENQYGKEVRENVCHIHSLWMPCAIEESKVKTPIG